ncbi:MAG: hypothetical protein H6712_32680 [Myxococcales bacterium]|nr:hypothetical protein [Myxococcales bacterium]MCB9718652.1 hypothetical protein [Myxococcales bacterium]
MSRLLRALGIVGTIALVGYALVLLFSGSEAGEAVEDVIADAEADSEGVDAEAQQQRDRVARAARGLMLSPDGPDGEVSHEELLASEVPPPTIPYGSGELDADTARASFTYAMDRVDAVVRARKRITKEDWDKLYREANDSFAALSIVLDPSDEAQSAELEAAYKRLKAGLKRVRIRGRKFGT